MFYMHSYIASLHEVINIICYNEYFGAVNLKFGYLIISTEYEDSGCWVTFLSHLSYFGQSPLQPFLHAEHTLWVRSQLLPHIKGPGGTKNKKFTVIPIGNSLFSFATKPWTLSHTKQCWIMLFSLFFSQITQAKYFFWKICCTRLWESYFCICKMLFYICSQKINVGYASSWWLLKQ